MLTTTPINPATTAPIQSSTDNAVLTELETLTSLRVLICVAKADGEPSPQERASIETAFRGVVMPAGVTLAGLLDEKIDLDAQLRLLVSPESREAVYHSAVALVHVDGVCTSEEQKRLDHLRTTLQVSDAKASLTRRILDEAKDTVLPSNIQPFNDSARRATEVKSDILKYSVISSALGAFPIPGLAIATDLAVVAVQVKMVRDIGQMWGHKVDKQAAISLLGGLGLGTGARIAVSNIAKLVPVWGSLVGASASFASTWALGKVADKYFEAGMKNDPASLRTDFDAAQNEGRAAYDSNKSKVESKMKQHEATLRTLGTDLAAGRITQTDYAARVEQMA